MEEMDLRLVHPKMESSFFGNPNQRNSVGSGEYPETFFSMFAEMAKRVWLLHCLAFSFDPEAAIFQVSKRCRFSEVFMESVNEEAFLSADGSPESDPRVAFTVKTLVESMALNMGSLRESPDTGSLKHLGSSINNF
ncbi:hypothetical protein RJ640_022438 [Escallonia rubra]|uniref:GIL1/IRKI C-terminal domain-containing protein n=1 Tax=Escallonia rubra TaxID=112253 RepID=A0AA88SCC8_9ASTE|nr:hypothetical protein RJ640_022438 [Escallonia rubra]